MAGSSIQINEACFTVFVCLFCSILLVMWDFVMCCVEPYMFMMYDCECILCQAKNTNNTNRTIHKTYNTFGITFIRIETIDFYSISIRNAIITVVL